MERLTPEELELFARAAVGKNEDEEWTTLEEMSREGARILKRKALGICGGGAVKTIEDMEWLLTETGIANSPEEARAYVPRFNGVFINYEGNKFLMFQKRTYEGREIYKISSIKFPFGADSFAFRMILSPRKYTNHH